MEAIGTEVKKIIQKFHSIRQQTLNICAPLITEDHVVQPIVDVSPPKWHLGHTSWFFEEMILKNFLPKYHEFDVDFSYVFNSYYESIGERVIRAERGNLTRPSLSDVHEYRRYVDAFMEELLENASDEKILYLTELGLQHEQQHQELLVTDIKYILGHNPLFPIYRRTGLPESKPLMEIDFIPIPAGLYEIGYKGNDFAYDNEQPSHKVYVNDFSIANRLVSNAEYLAFMEAGGYKDFSFWLMEGWELANANDWQAPLYWVKKNGQWHEFTLHGLRKVDLSAPVTHISFYEADAYAKWKGARLLTEKEWEVAARSLNQNTDDGNFLESGYLQPLNNGHEKIQMMGNAWEWTYSSYHPYPGYEKANGPIGEYNGKFMINQMVLRGGSCATPKDHMRVTYRNFFHPDKKWQFTGIRLAKKG